ncbi:MAG: glutamate 5-kinase [Tannerellaceae bacterium]|jgi:glutamate 5-kinase|nr:glutamate 5-kinase [Tannerellaceae bacterium]
MQRLVVKVGSNVLADRDGKPDVARMECLVDEMAALHDKGMEIALVSSGAVAFGRDELADNEMTGDDEVAARQVFAAVGQARLINTYRQLFLNRGIFCGQVLTTKENFGSQLHYRNQKHCMQAMLANGIIPVINENDTVSVTELMFTDNDELAGLIASLLEADALILLSNIDGIYDRDPQQQGAKVLPEILPGQEDIEGMIRTDRKSSFGRGGMMTKYRIACLVASKGIEVFIANGCRKGILTALAGDDPDSAVLCTRFRPAQWAM